MNWFQKYFIPHKDNNHKPRLFRESVVFFLIAMIVVVEFFVLGASMVIHKTEYFLSSILPNALIELTNENRIENNIATLKTNELLNKAAQMKADDMVRNGYFAHTSSAGLTPWYWIMQSGYLFDRAGENLAVNFYGSEDVVRAWMNSPTHRKNIVNSGFSEIGIGIANGIYQGRDAIFVVQMFGAPLAIASAPTFIEKQNIHITPTIATISRQKVITSKSNDNAFIMIENEPTTTATKVLAAETNNLPQSQPSALYSWTFLPKIFFYNLFLSPNLFLVYLYLLASIIVVFSLMLSFIIEFRRGHLGHLLYGTALFLILIFFVAINQIGVFGGTILA
ncbi:MAG: CAP domain-containing protein [Patescibacteria group bacterium]